jgi:hypothetical protein
MALSWCGVCCRSPALAPWLHATSGASPPREDGNRSDISSVNQNLTKDKIWTKSGSTNTSKRDSSLLVNTKEPCKPCTLVDRHYCARWGFFRGYLIVDVNFAWFFAAYSPIRILRSNLNYGLMVMITEISLCWDFQLSRIGRTWQGKSLEVQVVLRWR